MASIDQIELPNGESYDIQDNRPAVQSVDNLPQEIASFDEASTLPLSSLKVAINPIQDLHGYDHPWAGGAGKNKLPLSVSEIKSSNGGANSWTNNSKEISGIVYTILTDSDENVIGIKANGTATANSILYLMSTTTPPIQLDGQSVIISMAGFSKGAYKDNSWHDILAPSTESAVTLNGDVVQMWGQINNGVQVNNIVIQPMVRLASVTDATFAPYSNICPISGWDECKVTRCGENLFDKATITENKIINNTTGEETTSYGRFSSDYIKVNPSTDYYASNVIKSAQWYCVFYYDKNKNYLSCEGLSSTGDNASGVVTTPSGCNYVRLVGVSTYKDDVSFVVGNQAPSSYSAYNGHTYIIDLDGTRYGGSLDVVNGVLTVDRVNLLLNGLSYTMFLRPASIGGSYFRAIIPQKAISDADSTQLYSHGISNNPYSSKANCARTFESFAYLFVGFEDDMGIDTVEKFNQWLANNSTASICYKIKEPQTIQLTPTQVKSLLGQNNIWADTGKVLEAEYVVSKYDKITAKISEYADKANTAIDAQTVNGHTVDKDVPSNAVFTDTKVTQTVTDTTDATYELLFSGTADDTTRTEGARKSRHATFNPYKKAFTFGDRSSGSTVGGFSYAEGTSVTASGAYSHAEGGATTASGSTSHAEGGATTASGSQSHAEGGGTTASGDYSHAEGSGTNATRVGSHAEGGGTTAGGDYSHAEGSGTNASGSNAHAEGGLTIASGTVSHAEGGTTTASGLGSHAEGTNTVASGYCSHAEGVYTIANHVSQHVFGLYNIADSSTAASTERGNYIEIVGNGTSSARSNARTLDWDGNEWLAGNLTVGVSTSNTTTVMSNGISGTDHQTNAGSYGLSISGGGTGIPGLSLINRGSNANTISVTANDITLGGTSNTWDGTNTSLKTAISSLDSNKVSKSGDTMTGSLYAKFSDIDASKADNNISTILYPTTFHIIDNAGRTLTRLEGRIDPNGSIGSYWYVRNYDTSGTQVDQKGIRMTMNKSGTLTYGIADNANFRSAINTLTKDVNTLLTTSGAFEASTARSFNLTEDFNNYIFLIIEIRQYNNVYESIIVPTSYFNDTGSATRPRLYAGYISTVFDVYKNTNTSIYVMTNKAVSDAYRVHIIGYGKS